MISANVQEQDMAVAAAVQNLYHGSTQGWPRTPLILKPKKEAVILIVCLAKNVDKIAAKEMMSVLLNLPKAGSVNCT